MNEELKKIVDKAKVVLSGAGIMEKVNIENSVFAWVFHVKFKGDMFKVFHALELTKKIMVILV